jgi:hypothetical protein
MNALAVQVGRCWRDGRVVDVECMAVEAQENCHTIKAATARSENSNTESAAGTAQWNSRIEMRRALLPSARAAKVGLKYRIQKKDQHRHPN